MITGGADSVDIVNGTGLVVVNSGVVTTCQIRYYLNDILTGDLAPDDFNTPISLMTAWEIDGSTGMGSGQYRHWARSDTNPSGITFFGWNQYHDAVGTRHFFQRPGEGYSDNNCPDYAWGHALNTPWAFEIVLLGMSLELRADAYTGSLPDPRTMTIRDRINTTTQNFNTSGSPNPATPKWDPSTDTGLCEEFQHWSTVGRISYTIQESKMSVYK